MAVDVVVVNYKTPQLLADFCASYEDVAFEGCTLTVIDVEAHESPAIRADHVMHTPDNIGYGRACNLGAAYGHNDVILLANADTLLTSGFQECYDQLVAHVDWGVLGPRQVDEQELLTAGGITGPDTCPRQRGWRERDNGQYSDVLDDVPMVSGALYFVKRMVWDELSVCPTYRQSHPQAAGPFLETYLYYEDTWFSYHARAHGWKCVYYGPVRMVHYWHRSVNQPGGWSDTQMSFSLQIYKQTCAAHGILCES